MGKTKKNVGAIAQRTGVSFRVWAPFANSVSIIGSFNNWSEQPMESENDGYWYTRLKDAKPGQEYKFVIRNDEITLHKNDPRALHVTTDDGSSTIVDVHFDWDDDNFIPPPLNKQVIYELHVGTFFRSDQAESGNFDDVISKLDHLADLGINMIELMPIATMSTDHGWGYAPDYIYAVESLYGGRQKFMKFIKAAHQRGIGVILDVVYNHLGPDNLDIWQFDGWQKDGYGGIYFYNDWRAQTPWGNNRLDYGRPEVRQYILDNVQMWLKDCHVDGLRLDSTGFLRTVYGRQEDPGNEIPEAWMMMQQINTLAKKINPNSVMIAEDFSGNEWITKSTGENGAGFDAQWETNLPYVLRTALDPVEDTSRNLSSICDALARRYNGNTFQRVIYSDSHDSASNGAARLNEEIAPGHGRELYARRRLLLASAMILTAPGIPMLFQGQEFMESGSFSDWQALDWEKAERFSGISDAHQDLIALRKNNYGNTRGLTGQSFAILHLNEESKVLAYHRWDQGGNGDDVIVVFNFANRTQKNYSINFPRKGKWTVRFNSDWKGYSPDFKDTAISEVIVEKDMGSLTIAPYSVLILSQD